jgi:hypothetical protein
MRGNLALCVVQNRTTRRKEEATWGKIRAGCSIGVDGEMPTAGRRDTEVRSPGRVLRRLAVLAGLVGEVPSRDEVVVAQAGGAPEGAGFDEVDDGGDVAVEAAVAVDER